MSNDTPVIEIIGSFQRFTASWIDHRTGVQKSKIMYALDEQEAVWSVRGSLRDKCRLNGRVYNSADYDVTATPAERGE